jgi:hypothetical protein
LAETNLRLKINQRKSPNYLKYFIFFNSLLCLILVKDDDDNDDEEEKEEEDEDRKLDYRIVV